MTDEDFLHALYKGVLRRAPDEQGFVQHLEFLNRTYSNPNRYAQLVAGFVDSTEFRLNQFSRDLDNPANPFLPDMSEVVFDYAIPIGSFCHTAMALKRAGLRHFSTPFDWLFSSPDMVAQCLNDDFSCFLDKEQYEPIPLEQRQDPNSNFCHHRHFKEVFGIHFVFNHHKPYEIHDYQYFQRCVDRFRQSISSSGHKLMVYFSWNPIVEGRLENLIKTLRIKVKDFVLLIFHFPVVNQGELLSLERRVRTKRLQHDVLSVEMSVSAPTNGVTFAQPADDLLLTRFLKSFRVQGAVATR